MLATLRKRIESVEPMIKAQAGVVQETVYGVVDKINDDGTPHFIRKWKGTIGNMRPTDETPTVYVIEKLEPLILEHRKWKLVYGGRAGTKYAVNGFLHYTCLRLNHRLNGFDTLS